MIVPERNDVDISKVFSWGSKFEIVNPYTTESLIVYIRLVGDSELNRARVFGLRESANLRKRLKLKDSDDRAAFIPEVEDLDAEYILDALVYFKTKELTLDAFRNIRLPLPKDPSSNASLEELEKHQKEVDDYPAKREEEIKNFIYKYLNEYRNKVNTSDVNILYKEYEKLLINQICENEMIIKFREMCTYFGVYKDENYKVPLFPKFEEFTNLPKEIKDQLISNYLSLEVSGEDLKKLLDQTL
jgi:hypothetical protein